MAWLIWLLVIFSTWLILPLIAKKIQIGIILRRCKAGGLIVLSYDDGPSERVTREVLELLRSYNATATFFLLGYKVDALKEMVTQIITAGHEIGSHSHQHLHAWKCNPISVFLDIRKGLCTVQGQAKCRLFRAPYGKITLGSLIQLWLQGWRQAWWTIDSTDTWPEPRPIEAVLEEIRHQGGGVILMHDHDRTENPERNEYVINLTKKILEMAQSEGFNISPMSKLFS